jgi:3-oxoacyl-(acyl-carrier-protein) synthase
MLAEQYSNAGALQVAAAALVIEEQMVYPTVNYQEKDPDCDLNIVTFAQSQSIENILINAIGPGRACSSMVIGRFER